MDCSEAPLFSGKKKRRHKPASLKRTKCLLLQAATSKALVEAIDSTTRINDFLLTGEKRMTPTADVNSDILRKR